MTIGTGTARNPYLGDDSTPIYAWGFKIFTANDLEVKQRTVTTDVETLLTYLTDFTFPLTDVGKAGGGNITLVAGNLPTGDTLVIRYKSPLTQLTSLRNQERFYPDAVEDALDQIIAKIQQQQDEIDRSLRFVATETPSVGLRELPRLVDRKSKVLGFDTDGNPVATALSSTTVVFSSLGETVVGRANASSIRSDIEAGGIFSNLGLTATVLTNALTITLTTSAGAVPSAADPVGILFGRTPTASGLQSFRAATATAALVISSGSTLGHLSGATHFIYVYAIDNAGTIELAATSTALDHGFAKSTSAEGGVGGADSISTIYSTTARSNVRIQLIGRIRVTEAAAGTWATAPDNIAIWPFAIEHPSCRVERSGTQSIPDSTTTGIVLNSSTFDTHNSMDLTTGIYTIPKAGKWEFSATCEFAANATGNRQLDLHKDGSLNTVLAFANDAANSGTASTLINGYCQLTLAVGDTINLDVTQSSGGALNINSALSTFGVFRWIGE